MRGVTTDDHERACGPTGGAGPGRQGRAAPLHRPARRRARQGHPAPPLPRHGRGGRHLLRRRHGHRPAATRLSSAARRGTSTSRSGPTSTRSASSRGSPRSRGASARRWTLDGSEPLARLPTLAAAQRGRRTTPRAASTRSSRPSSSSSSSSATPTARAGSAATSTSSRASTRSASVSDPRDVVLQMLLWCDELGLEAFAANHEFMNSQYEINVKHSGALDAADRAFMLKAAVKEIAVREGLLATFMGRPFADQGGSGFHLHLSLNDGDGRNAFADEDGPDGLSRARRGLHRGRARARARPAGAARADRQRLQADPPRQPRADARQLGPRQPHRVLPRPEGARRPLAGRDPHRRRLGECAT